MILATLSLFVMLTATSVHAQSDIHLKVNIPFEFSVREKTFPAGEYTVRYVTQGVLSIQSVDSNAVQTFMTLSARTNTKPDKSSVVFNRYGDQYFLSTIWRAGDNTGLALRRPHAEELIRAKRLLATGASERQTVSIVAHH
jgi:hypothetical protein